MRSRMSIIPKLVSQMWEQMERPHRLLDQHFGQGMLHPEQFFNSVFESPRRLPYAYYRPMLEMMREDEDHSSKGYSVIKNDKEKFHVALDVQQFKPEEINVKIVDDYIVVEGKHEEKHDDHGIISRHFVRKYMIPDQCDPEKAASTLTSDGILTITAPRKPETIEEKKERVLKIERVAKPAAPIEEKKEKEQPQIENKKMAQSQ